MKENPYKGSCYVEFGRDGSEEIGDANKVRKKISNSEV